MSAKRGPEGIPLRQQPRWGQDEVMSLLARVQSHEDLKDTSLWIPVTNTATDMISALGMGQARIAQVGSFFCD